MQAEAAAASRRGGWIWRPKLIYRQLMLKTRRASWRLRLGDFTFVFRLLLNKKTSKWIGTAAVKHGDYQRTLCLFNAGKICMIHLHNIKRAPAEETLLPRQRKERLSHRVATKCSALKHPELCFRRSLRGISLPPRLLNRRSALTDGSVLMKFP